VTLVLLRPHNFAWPEVHAIDDMKLKNTKVQN